MNRVWKVSLAVAIILAAGIATTLILGGGQRPHPAPSTTPSSAPAPATPPTGAGFADPTTDRLGRKITIPNNPAGQILAQREPGPRTECGPGQAVSSPESVMIQRSYGMPILMSATDGPTRLDNTTLLGYRRSPQGAALAGWNAIARTFAAEPAVVIEALGKLAILAPEKQAALTGQPTHPTPEADRYRRLFAAPDAFRILSCDDTFAAVELAVQIPPEPASKPARQWAGIRVNLVWRGDWLVQTSQDPRSLGSGQKYPNLEGWTPWAF
ncbi:hypothetical protein [Nocardia sp. XZ_19_369]|uniref:hypothetical protein n=1 Tax=Nocardia sp. XZ_19_369 TaxID=2769487 RepID=UPI00188F3DBD|nr:hypothetical protein [Nocardia sp. XZ_19_369]